MRTPERVPAEAGALRRERAALADLVSRLADAVSGIGDNISILDLGGLDVVTGLRVAGFGGDFLLMFIFILLGVGIGLLAVTNGLRLTVV